jgi:hypothetical protein
LNFVNISALYLSVKRLNEVVGLRHSYNGMPSDNLQALRFITELEDASLRWLVEAQLPTLGELLAEHRLRPGAFFTHNGTFIGKGILQAASRFGQGKPLAIEPLIYAKLDAFHLGARLEMQAHPENFIAASVPGELSGQKRLFVVGRLTESELPVLRGRIYLVGHLHDEPRREGQVTDSLGRLPYQMEVFCSQIDQFAGASEVRPTKQEVERLAEIPESQIKTAFAEIIGEPFVPKDWGGEQSDLFSTRVSVGGRSLATAFVFKGPSKFKPLTVADLGKNGDQISRLFREPADFLVLQHCHQITPAVRDHMRAFANQISRLRPFCLINGADTVTVLKAHSKVGYRLRTSPSTRKV